MPNREFEDFVIKVFFACTPDEKAKSFLDTYQSALEKDGIPIQISYEIVDPGETMCNESLLSESKEAGIQAN